MPGRDTRPRSPRLSSLYPAETARLPPTPPLPGNWTIVHDRAICVLDACGYSVSETVKKLHSAFQELAGQVLTPPMIDKRLRMLDEDIEVDYFQIGLNRLTAKTNDPDQTSHIKSKGGGSHRRQVSNKSSLPSSPTFSKITPEWEESHMNLHDVLSEGRLPTKVLKHPPPQLFTAKLISQVTFAESDTSSTTHSKSNTVSTVRSQPFGTGFLSYRTNNREDLRE